MRMSQDPKGDRRYEGGLSGESTARNHSKFGRPVAAFAAVSVVCGVLSSFNLSARANGPGDQSISELRNYVQQITDGAGSSAPDSPRQATAPADRHKSDGDALASLRAFVQRIHDDAPQSVGGRVKLAEADNAFDALREFLQRHNGTAPAEQPNAPAPPAARPRAPIAEAPVIAAVNVGSNVCLGCHSSQAATFDYTLMGRLEKQGKLQCETCHGPGSAHVQAVGCATCHGDGGISKRPGMPSLVGLDPQYLVGAMKAYVTGHRNYPLKKALFSGLGDAELNNIAHYYARQVPGPAQTPLVGNPSAGKAAAAPCAACHGDRGVSVIPAFPSLAGQDAQYLADATKAYKIGARDKVVACAACHGERGISKTPGIPSLVGLDPQYLVVAMKAYVTGRWKNDIMKALLSGLGDKELNNIALYYAQQVPSRAPTPTVGDVSAGKTARAGCDGCHSQQAVTANPAWPGLAGQDAKYLADATEAYKDGSRTDELMKGLVASLDQQTINNLASYYAGLNPEQPSSAKNTPAKPAPVLNENRLLASLDQRTIDNVASYYASQSPAQPEIAKNAPNRPVLALVTRAAPADGLSAGGIVSYRPDDPGRTAEQNNRICLTCHERGQRTYWQGSVHEERGLACTSCHTIMTNVSAKSQLKTAFPPDTCFQCHKDRRAQMFRSSHMATREGKVVCSDCHNPHGSATEAMLWENSVNDNCYKCHAEKRGPFLFEHAPVRENCLSCHDPHGSMNEASLKMSRPRLCYQCHTIGPHGATSGAFANKTMSRGCTNCHTQIHGSNSPAGGAFNR